MRTGFKRAVTRVAAVGLAAVIPFQRISAQELPVVSSINQNQNQNFETEILCETHEYIDDDTKMPILERYPVLVVSGKDLTPGDQYLITARNLQRGESLVDPAIVGDFRHIIRLYHREFQDWQGQTLRFHTGEIYQISITRSEEVITNQVFRIPVCR